MRLKSCCAWKLAARRLLVTHNIDYAAEKALVTADERRRRRAGQKRRRRLVGRRHAASGGSKLRVECRVAAGKKRRSTAPRAASTHPDATAARPQSIYFFLFFIWPHATAATAAAHCGWRPLFRLRRARAARRAFCVGRCRRRRRRRRCREVAASLSRLGLTDARAHAQLRTKFAAHGCLLFLSKNKRDRK